MTSFILKIIAVITMLFDHTGYIIFGHFSFMNYIGRLSFPIFAFLITEGYKYTKNLKKYFARLLIFAIISQIPYMLFIDTFSNSFSLNILFTLTLGLLGITIYDKIKYKPFGILLVIILSFIAQYLHFDYGWFGIVIIFIFYIFKKQKLLMNIYICTVIFVNYFFYYITTLRMEFILIILFCSLSLIPINLYNEKKGKNIKYFLYVFYPMHLIALYLLTLI